DRARAGGRVARVPNCPGAFQFFQLSLTKHLRDQAHVFVHQERRPRAVARDNAGAFLAAMLQGEKPVVSQDSRVRMAEHTEKPTLMPRVSLGLGWLGEVDARSRKFFGV